MPEPRDHMVLVLDVDSIDDALAIARPLEPWFATVKVGYQLYAAEGPKALEALRENGFFVFADLKLYDIPNTVEHGARNLARHGVSFVNFHAAGGVDMLRAAIAGLHDGAIDAGVEVPISLAVTVVTSDPDTSALEQRMQIAREAQCDGVVCAGTDVPLARKHGLRTMVPGIRLAGGDVHDQARVDTPGDAIARGADWLVIGRTVTEADEPEFAAIEVTRAVADALASAPG
ncbi:MAG: orotidine-5'-phosphate decarboxylase [Acidimicrobiia bacterium]